MSDPRQSFWTGYYEGMQKQAGVWLDYSNQRVHAQTLALALEAAGPVTGRRCLDAGCGRGLLARCLHALQAAEVVGVDPVAEAIQDLQRDCPGISWRVGSVTDAATLRPLGDFDLVFTIEVLQLVDLRQTLQALWDRVRPGGRLVAVAPNRENPIAAKVVARFEGKYWPPTFAEIADAVGSLPQVASWAQRGMRFQEDQRIAPYLAGPWISAGLSDPASNRIALSVTKLGPV